MNRRAFISVLAGLPVVGKYFGKPADLMDPLEAARLLANHPMPGANYPQGKPVYWYRNLNGERKTLEELEAEDETVKRILYI